jgi:hypothetical protein
MILNPEKIERLKKRGYCRISRKFGLLSRIDCNNWRERLAAGHVRGMDWVKLLGDKSAADYYRRCASKDHLEVGKDAGLKFPTSGDGPTEYLP